MTESKRNPGKSRRKLFIEQHGKCYWCGRRCMFRTGHQIKSVCEDFTLDHVHPIGEGGEKREWDNIVGACYECNFARNSMLTKLRAKKSIIHIYRDNAELHDKLRDSIIRYVSTPSGSTA